MLKPIIKHLIYLIILMHAMKRFLTIWIFHVGDEKNIHGDQHTRQQRHEQSCK